MNTQSYPTWLVPLDIVIELKETGYKGGCYFEFSKDNGLTLETLKRENSIIGTDDSLFGTNECWQSVGVPIWTDIPAWFRARGLYNYIHSYITSGNFYTYSIYDNDNFDKCCGRRDTYEEAQKEYVKALIKTYKDELKKNSL